MRTSTTTSKPAVHPAVFVAGATVAAIVTWIIARVADVDFEVEAWGGETMDVGLGIVTAAAAGASLAGWGLLALLQRRTARAREVWTIIATAVLLVSLPGPLFADASTGARISLTLMHVVVAAVLIPSIPSRAPMPVGSLPYSAGQTTATSTMMATTSATAVPIKMFLPLGGSKPAGAGVPDMNSIPRQCAASVPDPSPDPPAET